ncbi:hypothetical protein M3172_08915 [Mesobacillus subterraneus]|uniref:hypothetical protein n=1 Tax=Mesobacillus subterraneus TaxID=285983 RepID=UPI00203C5457|nr:hypothetical protein [Mesobacillus subterraneus]MCM3573315.1 hypothetical protein [Mesobacillus subterraneus]
MANWAEGTLKIRGTRADIKSFLTGALKPCFPIGAGIREFITGEKPAAPEVEIREDEYDFKMKSEDGFYIEGCRRAFVGSVDWWFEDKHQEVLVIDDFKQAWGVDATPLAELSERYNVDLKVYVFEQGMEFNQEIEIHKGEIIKNNEITFDDYKWECIYPNLGG